MGLGGALGEGGFGDGLRGEGLGLEGIGLGFGGDFAGRCAGWVGAVFDGEERGARGAVEEVEVALLGGLGDGGDLFSVALDGDEGGGRGEVAVPDVVMDALEVPEALAGGGVEGEEGVGVEIVAEAGCAVEVGYRGAGGDVDDAAVGVDGHAGPVVGCAGGLPGVGGPGLAMPGFVAGFAGVGDGVEGPAEGSGADVVGADVAGRARGGFRVCGRRR